MPLRTQIFSMFLAILVVTIATASLFYYSSAREARLNEIYNHMESISEAKKLRMRGIIRKRQEQLILLQTRDQLREQFASYMATRNRATQQVLSKSLEATRDKIPSFKELHLVSLNGIVQASSSPRYKGTDVSQNESFRHAIRGELCMHEFFYDDNNRLSIHVAGMLALEDDNIGVIMVKTDAEDILSIIKDYTGLGETGETTLAKRLGRHIYYLTPTRFNPVLHDSLVVLREPNRAMGKALAGVEDLLTDVVDYRDEKVIASSRYLAETGWGLVTKMDRKEALASIRDILRQLMLLSLVLIVIVAIAAHFFARHITRPIVKLGETSREIARGNLTKRINYSSNNEVGRLARNFNLMADRLVEANKSLEQKVEEMDHINDSLNRFAFVVSHDLKSPLHAISSLMEHIKESLGACDEPDVQKMLGMAEAKARHMQDLINGILYYSMAGMAQEQQEEVQMEVLLEELIQQLDVPEYIKLTIEEMPVIRIERVLVLQIFQNLISNAVKYMDKPLGWIKINYQQEGNFYKFSISDNGRGIDRRNFERIFDIFNKTNNVKGIDSTGIGLSIVKKIVESKGGRIWVESEPGTGSTFYFTLPLEAHS